MGVLAEEFLNSPRAKRIKLVVGPALLMTSLDMHGFSASLLPLTRNISTALLSPVAPSAWPVARTPGKIKAVKLQKELKAKPVKPSRNDGLAALLTKACDLLIGTEKELNGLDAKVGDGDTGSTIATGARSLKSAIGRLPMDDLPQLFKAISDTLGQSMGGSSGVVLAIMFSSAGVAARSGRNWTESLNAGLQRMMEYGGATRGDRTMIDALEPALDALVLGKPITRAARAARNGADSTARMKKARAGRSSYVSAANLAGVPDPGAVAVAGLFEGLAQVV